MKVKRIITKDEETWIFEPWTPMERDALENFMEELKKKEFTVRVELVSAKIISQTTFNN
jgi:hypothetical protein